MTRLLEVECIVWIILDVLAKRGAECICLTPEDTINGAVETLEDAHKCAKLFKEKSDKIEGIIVSLPNFGDERGIANALRLSGLNVPVLIHAFPDHPEKLDVANRRDSFCGKLSVCNNLTQYGITYSLTSLHCVDPTSSSFQKDLDKFLPVCKIVRGLRNVRLGQVGARTSPFLTVRYSEKLLEQAGIDVESIDLSEIFGRAWKLSDSDAKVVQKFKELKDYIRRDDESNDEAIVRMAKLGVVLDEWMTANKLAGTAVQCWTAIEEFYHTIPCTLMSMMSEQLRPSACETDITGLIGMYAMVLASGKPSAIVDWNNNYAEDPNKALVFHCSNLPKSLFIDPYMSHHFIFAKSMDKKDSYGTVWGRLKPDVMTYCRVSTNDESGRIRAYLGRGRITDDPCETAGGYGVVEIPNMQELLRFICEKGFEHHVALSASDVADQLYEAMSKYLNWDVYYHK